MSVNMHLLHSRGDFLSGKCAALSDEYGESFHHDISAVKKRNQGKWI
jgi:hypothetical protein